MFECEPADSPHWDLETFGMADGKYRDIEVLPGKSVLLNIRSEFASRYAGRP